MRQKGLLVCMLSGLVGVIGCALKKMPEGELVSVAYTRSGTMAGNEYEGRVEQDSTGIFVLKAMKEFYGPLFEKKLNTETMKHFRQIIEEEKMYKYKDSYTPIVRVLDGWGWSFYARFSDGSVISSHGSNANPSGNGLEKIRDYMYNLIQDGNQIEEPSNDN